MSVLWIVAGGAELGAQLSGDRLTVGAVQGKLHRDQAGSARVIRRLGRSLLAVNQGGKQR